MFFLLLLFNSYRNVYTFWLGAMLVLRLYLYLCHFHMKPFFAHLMCFALNFSLSNIIIKTPLFCWFLCLFSMFLLILFFVSFHGKICNSLFCHIFAQRRLRHWHSLLQTKSELDCWPSISFLMLLVICNFFLFCF